MSLANVTARRVWFIHDFVVWGLPNMGELEFLAMEKVGSEESVLYGIHTIGGGSQEVSFGNLVDNRGNQLPETIDVPRVLPRSRSSENVFVVGNETASSFKIARESDSSGPVTVDLLIVEMGS
ncbi:MAG: hypothetical protein U9N55_03795 [candidate division Zixibacteria bacterium]|nr:hypothetical protein [candidate division Zixibacteria bacterium]